MMVSRPNRPTSRRLLTALAVLTTVSILASCGLREDDTPRALAPDLVPAELSEPAPASTIAGDATTAEKFFMVEARAGGEQVLIPLLLRIPRPANEEDRRRAIIETLVGHRPGEDDRYSNAIPATTDVLDVRLVADGNSEPDVLEINLNQLEIASGNLKLAIAQMVFTATDIDGVRGVRFLLNGEPRAVPLDVGESEVGQVVTRFDFPELNLTATTTTTSPPADPVPADLGEG